LSFYFLAGLRAIGPALAKVAIIIGAGATVPEKGPSLLPEAAAGAKQDVTALSEVGLSAYKRPVMTSSYKSCIRRAKASGEKVVCACSKPRVIIVRRRDSSLTTTCSAAVNSSTLSGATYKAAGPPASRPR